MKTAPIVILILVSLAVGLDAQDAIPCTREGPMCKNCDTLGQCVKKETGGGFQYDPDKDENCVIGWMCDEWTLKCERQGTCRYKAPACPSDTKGEEEIFPNPYSCIGYYGCMNGDRNDYQCTNGKAFDPKKKDCSLDPTNDLCNDYPALCEKAGQTGTIGDSDFKYVCKEEAGPPHVIYPEISAADQTTPSSPTTPSTTPTTPSTTPTTPTTTPTTPSTTPTTPSTTPTTPSTTPTTPSTTPTTPSTTPTTPSTTPTTPSTTPTTPTTTPTTPSTTPTTPTTTPTTPTTTPTTPTTTPTTPTTTPTTPTTTPTTTSSTISTQPPTTPYPCDSEGYFEDPDNCMMFYVCYRVGSGYGYKHMTCRDGSHFDSGASKCVAGPCPTTLSTTPTTPTATPTTSTTTPTTTTSTISTQPPTTPYPCDSEGYFEDPDNCMMFYVCYRVGSGYGYKHMTCRDGSHFDSGASKCVAGPCPTKTTTTATNPTTPEYLCHSEGYFPGKNCTCFIKCYWTGNNHFGSQSGCCRSGSHFDSKKQLCVPGSC